MERKVILSLLAGMFIGATSAWALAPVAKTDSPVYALGAVWSAMHAGIPHETEVKEPAPTF